MGKTKRIAIIGAGVSGVTAIKACLEEGLEPVCIEKTTSIGGLWNYTEEVREGQACVMKSTVINTSKEIMAYSDFPAPKDYPNYFHNTYVMKYLHLYADNFELKKYIIFNTEVLSVKRSADFDQSGRWNIKVKDNTTGKEADEVYDGVLVCTGHHAEPNIPAFPGLDKFKGEVLHTHDFKKPSLYEDQRVLVIGIGNSGGDAAVELSRIASQVYMSTRSGTWILWRVAHNGLPGDIVGIRRVLHLVPLSIRDAIVEKEITRRVDLKRYGLKPKFSFTSQHPFVNDDLANRILCGSIIIKPDIKEFTETGVVFEDGTKEEIDTVLIATGYKFGFPFIDESVVKVENNQVNLYKYMFPPQLAHPTLAIIGCIQPIGALMPISELQSRWAARVFKGLTKIPSEQAMWKDIIFKQDQMSKRYVKSARHTIQVDVIPYMDEIASQIGCKPPIAKLFLTDPKLASSVFFGPFTPYQFRLTGPNTWSGAREAIRTQWERIEFPLKTRIVEDPPRSSNQSVNILKILVFIMALIAMLIKFIN